MNRPSSAKPRHICLSLCLVLACWLPIESCASSPREMPALETKAEFARDLLVAVGLDPGPGCGADWAGPYLSLLVYLGYGEEKDMAKPEMPLSRLEMSRILLRADRAGADAAASDPLAEAEAAGLLAAGPRESGACPVTKAEAGAAIKALLARRSAPAKTASKYERLEIRDGGIVGDFLHEPGASGQRLVVLLGGSEGGCSWSGPLDERTRRDLLDRHYAILSLGYFGAEGLPGTLESLPLEYFARAIDRCLSMPGVDPSGAALIGVSKGGEAALLVASRFPEKVKALVGIVPSSHVFQGIGPDFLPRGPGAESSSWSINGRDMAYAPFRYDDTLAAAERAFTEKGVLDWDEVYAEALAGANPDSAIPLEKADCPILLMSGERDEMWPSTAMCEDLVLRLEKKGFRNAVEHLRFAETGHDVLFAPGAWPRILAFLEASFPSRSQD